MNQMGVHVARLASFFGAKKYGIGSSSSSSKSVTVEPGRVPGNKRKKKAEPEGSRSQKALEDLETVRNRRRRGY